MQEELEFKSPKHEELYWAERHANDFTIAEHNREWFKREAEKLRSEVNASYNG